MRFYNILILLCISFALGSCDGILSDIYDPAPEDNDFVQGFITRSDSPGRYQLMLDARSYEEWHYINLKELSIVTLEIPSSLTGEWDGSSGWTYHHVEGTKYTSLKFVKTDPQPEPEDWDFAIHHFDVKTNGGSVLATNYNGIMSLPGSSSAFSSDDFTPDAWSTHQVITDLTKMMAYDIGYQNSYINPVLSQWATMDFSTPPPVYSSTGKVYLLRLENGETAALHLRSYMSQSGTKGFLTIDIKYPY